MVVASAPGTGAMVAVRSAGRARVCSARGNRLMAGKPKTQPMRPDMARYKLWRSMRVLTRTQGSFSQAELCVVAGGGKKNTQYYVQALVRAGYLRAVTPSRGGRPARYALIRDTGPHAPRWRRRDDSIFDRNLTRNLTSPDS